FHPTYGKGLYHFSDVAIYEANNFLKKLNVEEKDLHSKTLLSFVVDYSQNKYTYISSPFKSVFGYTKEYIQEAGPRFFRNLVHKSDLKVYDGNILPEIMQFLKKQHIDNHAAFTFSYNYRIKTNKSNYITVLQRSAFLLNQETGNLA